MKKKKIVLISGIIILLIIVVIVIIHIMLAEEYKLVIVSIEGDEIYCKNEPVDYISMLGNNAPEEFIDSNKSLQEQANNIRYCIKVKNAIIKDSNGNKIDFSKLEIGDKIYVLNIGTWDEIGERNFNIYNTIYIKVLEN